MDSKKRFARQSFNDERQSYQTERYSEASNKNHRLSKNRNSNGVSRFRKAQNRFYSGIRQLPMRILTLVLFLMIVMITGILTVYFTSPKSNKRCDMRFERVNKSSLIYSSQPRFIAINDLNKDNNIDIVVSNSGTDTIGIFLSNDDQTFRNEQIYSTGSQSSPNSIVINHFNNDNYFDIAVANFGTNNIGIFIGYHNQTFQNQKVFSTGSYRPWFISIADFNKDNHSDIVVVYYATDNIGIILGNGNGSFQSPIIYSTGYDSFPHSLVIADFNKDNQLDIAVANYGTDNIRIFLGYYNGTFANQNIYTTNHNSNPSSIAVGDFNNDQQLDIVVANYDNGSIGIFFGYSNGTFSAQIIYLIDSKSRPQFLSVGYFDNNNYLDVVVADSKNDQIHILLGSGNGTFSTSTTYDSIRGSYPIMVAVTDFNNDNQSYIAIANYGTNNVLILGGYSFKPSAQSVTYFIGHDSRPSAVVIYDFNNDGKLDMVVNNLNNDYILILNGDGNGNFVREQTYSTGTQSAPQYQCIGDLNNDNRMDIIVANFGTNCVGVLLGQDNRTFANVVTYSTGIGSNPWFVAVGDLNNDNHLDIVSTHYGSGNIGILIGYGNGTFADMVPYFIGINSNPSSAAVGDINNDKNLDIVVSLYTFNSVSVFLGNGTGTFEMLTNYSTGFYSNPEMLVLADFNRDNCLDIAVANVNSGTIGIFLGVGDGTFMTEVIYSTGSGSAPYSITTADFNNDNYYDIAVANYASDEVIIFFGDGNANFEAKRRYSTGSGSSPFGIAVADLNNDKHLEIIVTYWGSGYVAVLTEYNAAEFINQTTYLTGSAPHSYSLAVGDFNKDNRSDIVVVNSDTDDLVIYLNWSNGSFDAQTVLLMATNSYPQYVITGDINKDKHEDIVVVNSKSNSMNMFMGDSNGNFENQTIYSTKDNSNPYAISMGDFNNDDRVDFVIANEGTDSIGIFIGFNYTLFKIENMYSDKNDLAPFGVVVNDFNNDNYLDIGAVFRNTSTFGILLGYGNGTFGNMISYSTGIDSLPYMLAVSDFNNDGQMDIAVGNSRTNNIGIFFGYGNGSFAPMITYSTGDGSLTHFLAVADFNNDNRTDIVFTNSGTNNIGILLGYDNGSFQSPIIYSTGDYSYPYAVAIGEFNNDGRLDIVITNFVTSTVGIFLGHGDGSFEGQVTYSTGDQSSPAWAVIDDFNNDNQSDLAVSNSNGNNVGILFGYGNGSFATIVTYSSGDGTIPEFIGVGDFNHDNIPDIAVVNTGASTVVILFGFGDGTFLLGTACSTGILPITLAIADVNNDKRLDIVVANFGSNNLAVLFEYKYQPFAGVTQYSTGDGSMPHSVAVADFNNDGWLDIIVANYGTDNFGIFFGYGTKGFDSMIKYSTGINSGPYYVALADFNNDNQSDVVVTKSHSDSVAIFLGSSNGTFANGSIYSTGDRSQPYGVAIGDLNNDNMSDIVIANSGTNTILVLYGYGDGTFGNKSPYELSYGYHPYSIAITDLNQDNWMDIVVVCYDTDHIETLVKMC